MEHTKAALHHKERHTASSLLVHFLYDQQIYSEYFFFHTFENKLRVLMMMIKTLTKV